MAESLACWIRDDAAPRVAALGGGLRSVDNYDDFECRSRNRMFGAKLSNHGKGIAIDVRSFTLADGRVIGLTDMTAPKDLREALRDSACRRFTTVLGPGADRHHAQPRPSRSRRALAWLSHLRMGRARTAAADRSRQRAIAGEHVPLPRPRPAIAAAR